ncbi:MAG: hypothetical protein K2N74_02820, partial [Clostridiales bacterium]|nr:hypothetical protein [Clostridiales bacterium]
GITVDFGKDTYIYNGEQQGPDPKPSRNVKIVYEYFNGADDTSLGTTKPTDVGQYYVAVKFENESFDTDFRLDPSRFYFEIVPIELTTLDWADQSGNKAPIENVASETKYKGGSDYTDLYDYEVYEVLSNGTRVLADKDNLEYDTDYVAVLSPKNGNAVFADDAEVEHPFHTGFDPSKIQIDVPKPDYDNKLPYAGAEQTLNIKNWNDIKDHVADIVRDDGVTGEDAFKVTNVGTYKVTITLRTDENAFWKGTDEIEYELEFEVVIRELERPTMEALVYTGNEFKIEDYMPADLKGWVEYEITGFEAKVEGTPATEDENGNVLVLRAGEYHIVFRLLDSKNTKWKDEGGNENVSYRVALLANDPNEVETTWEIKKAKRKGTW